ncbi:MAG: TolC family protein [Synergistaceae bacterium]|nr:TolC family protein [Synergistaceae bacterium]
MKKIITSLTLLITILALSSAAFAADAAPASKDAAITDGKWTELARRYPIPAVSGDVVDAPSAEVLASWWNILNDETLTKLIMMSLNNNRDLVSARAKVQEARASLGINKAAVLPWLDASGYWDRGQTPVNTGGSGSIANVYHLGVDASWEIDIFGGRATTIKSGVATLQAQNAALHSTWVSLSAETAINYLSLRTLQESLAIARENLALQKDSLEMVQSRYKTGLTDILALNQATYIYEQTRASIPPIETGIENMKNNLAILTGVVPGSLEEMLAEKKPIPKAKAVNLVGIPANALRRRPDIFAAERQLAAQIARTKSARADLWPKFYLAGSIGTETLGAEDALFTGPQKVFSFGPRISWPIFHWGAIKNNIRVQGARQEQYLAAYEKTVLSAVGEVRDAITAEIKEHSRNEALKNGVESAKVAWAAANEKYKNGLTDYNTVIAAQQALLQLSEAYAKSEGEMTSNLVRLFKALGGGWEPLSETAPAPGK